MNASLIRVPIVDKNGRHTTVLKKAVNVAATTPVMPAPGTKVAGKTNRSMLPLPAPLTEAESKLCYTELNDAGKPLFPVAAANNAQFLALDTQAILKGIIEQGSVSDGTIDNVLCTMGIASPDYRNEDFEHNMLLISQNMIDRGYLSEIDLNTSYVIKNCIHGLWSLKSQKDREAEEKILTQEDLERASTVVHVMMSLVLAERHKDVVTRSARMLPHGRPIQTYTMPNKFLAPLIMDRQDDADRIITYLGERGARGKKDVEALRDFLDSDEGNSVVREGWL